MNQKKNRTKLKRIIWAMILVLSLCVYPDAYAREKCSDLNNSGVKSKFGIKINSKSNVVSMSSNPPYSATFNVYVNNKYVGQVSPGGSVSVKNAVAGVAEDSDGYRYTIKAVLADEYVVYDNGNEKCYFPAGNAEIHHNITKGKEKKSKGNCNSSWVDGKEKELKTAGINCDKNWGDKTFEGAFCEAKKGAEKAGNTYNLNKSNIASNARFKKSYKIGPIRCEYDIANKTKVPTDASALQDEKYFTNQYYLYGKATKTETYGHYIYHYAPGHRVTGEAIKCTRICEESVKVEYGPPVAKKAGMCFEYRIRVTSRVDCHIDANNLPAKPNSDCNECTPVPICTSADGGGGVYNQGGPSEEFDACIQKCDGGDYSKKCSDQCYKDVYGTTKTKATKQEPVAGKLSAFDTDLAACEALNPKGCYYIRGGKHWSGGGAGRWYWNNSWGIGGHQYVVAEDGFYRAVHDDGDLCHDNCNWTGCSGKVYLNPKVSEKDYKDNVAKYKKAVEACNKQATCVSETAEYTISASYNGKWEKFPRTMSYDYTISKKSTTESKKGTTLLKNLPKETPAHEGIRGCYWYGHENEPEKQRMYRSTWTFPGTWMNAKTGEISYDENKSAGWGEYDKKFCIPFNTEPVNSEWWSQFYQNRYKDTNYNFSYNNSSIGTKCLKGSTSPGYKFNSSSGSKSGEEAITWNIKGETKNFGYFGWNLNIECFYATPPYPITKKNSEPTGGGDTSDPCTDDVRIRSIEPSNMFPEKNGDANKSVTIKANQTGSTAQVGRQPGFNWSQYAVSQEKNGSYYSDPVKLISKIQQKDYVKNLYKDSNLDYQFKLSRNDLLKLRANSQGTSANYSNYNDNNFYMDAYGVLRYHSSVIDEYASKRPNKSAEKCNNLKGNGCE